MSIFTKGLSAIAFICTLTACCEETPHEHDTDDFDSLADCEAHYEEEGHDAEEITELCEGLT